MREERERGAPRGRRGTEEERERGGNGRGGDECLPCVAAWRDIGEAPAGFAELVRFGAECRAFSRTVRISEWSRSRQGKRKDPCHRLFLSTKGTHLNIGGCTRRRYDMLLFDTGACTRSSRIIVQFRRIEGKPTDRFHRLRYTGTDSTAAPVQCFREASTS